jgi:hypothetical protein
MTTSEFKAWFEGYTENIAKVPTQKQWARIQERVTELVKSEDREPLVIFKDRYRDYPYRPWWPHWTCSSTSPDLMIHNTASSTAAQYQNSGATLATHASSVGSVIKDDARQFGKSVHSFSLSMAREIGRDEAVADAG